MPTRLIRAATIAAGLVLASSAAAQSTFPAPVEADFVARDVTFADGQRLGEVKMHYRTVGTPRKGADGVVRNAVLILHGTGGSGAAFLGDSYGGLLFGKGQLLDAERYYIVLPDNVGHGGSSKPSDGLRMKFPAYRYTDMVRLQHRLVTEGLGLTHLRLIMGTSMGAMHSWMWGYMYPAFADGLVPLASNPVEIAGRNRMWRKALVDAIVTDPTWKDGNYTDSAARHGQRAGLPADCHQHAPPVAEAVADRRGGRSLAGRSNRCPAEDDRRQRHHLSLPRLGGLRPVAASRADHRTAAGDQLR